MTVSPRSGCQHKAWGVSPRKTPPNTTSPRSGRQRNAPNGRAMKSTRCRPLSRASPILNDRFLGLTPQALCSHPLRGLKSLRFRPHKLMTSGSSANDLSSALSNTHLHNAPFRLSDFLDTSSRTMIKGALETTIRPASSNQPQVPSKSKP
jgi:hypothetical protein